MSKERFNHVENDIVNYIDDNKTGITYITTNYYDMKNLTKLLNKQEQQIADLEAKLAESKEEIKVIDEDRQFKAEMWTRFADKCKELKKQLAKVQNSCDYYMNRANDLLIKNQDKISFAVEKLTEVKEYFRDGSGTFAFYEIEECIDKAIKEME